MYPSLTSTSEEECHADSALLLSSVVGSSIGQRRYDYVPSSNNRCGATVNQSHQVTSSPSIQDSTQVYHISSTTSSLMQDIQNLPTVTSLQIHQSDPNLQTNKTSICSHPLYPFVSALLEKCELATANPDHPPIDTFENDFAVFLQTQQAQNKEWLIDDDELDPLMVKAIQVLRIHLVELKKVTELCKDFCSRYINCLRSKIQTDPLIHDSEPSSPEGSEALSPDPYSLLCSSDGSGGNAQSIPTYMGMMNSALAAAAFRSAAAAHGNSSGIPLEMCSYLMNASSTPGSETPFFPVSSSSSINYSSVSNGNVHHIGNNSYGHSSSSPGLHLSLGLDASKQKRGVLPKKATQVMKQWLFQHLVHPYPTEDEKRHLAAQTNLTLLQVNNWFINARRRILQPMLDANNATVSAVTSSYKKSTQTDSTHTSSDGDSFGECATSTTNKDSTHAPSSAVTCGGLLSGMNNKRKKSSNNRPSTNRFWPASLAEAASLAGKAFVTAANKNERKKSPSALEQSSSASSSGTPVTSVKLEMASSSGPTTTTTSSSIVLHSDEIRQSDESTVLPHHDGNLKVEDTSGDGRLSSKRSYEDYSILDVSNAATPLKNYSSSDCNEIPKEVILASRCSVSNNNLRQLSSLSPTCKIDAIPEHFPTIIPPYLYSAIDCANVQLESHQSHLSSLYTASNSLHPPSDANFISSFIPRGPTHQWPFTSSMGMNRNASVSENYMNYSPGHTLYSNNNNNLYPSPSTATAHSNIYSTHLNAASSLTGTFSHEIYSDDVIGSTARPLPDVAMATAIQQQAGTIAATYSRMNGGPLKQMPLHHSLFPVDRPATQSNHHQTHSYV